MSYAIVWKAHSDREVELAENHLVNCSAEAHLRWPEVCLRERFFNIVIARPTGTNKPALYAIRLRNSPSILGKSTRHQAEERLDSKMCTLDHISLVIYNVIVKILQPPLHLCWTKWHSLLLEHRWCKWWSTWTTHSMTTKISNVHLINLSIISQPMNLWARSRWVYTKTHARAPLIMVVPSVGLLYTNAN